MEGLSGDLQIKYQKIASEYAKLRAQANVLKKAVVDEQGRNVELRDVLREREQSLRKSTQEMDSLTFRNQQLTKRVTVLQEELELLEARPKRGKTKTAELHPDFASTNVIDEELQKKIAENVRLVTVMQDNESAHRQEILSLNERVEVLEHELQKHRIANDNTEQKFKAVIDRLEGENLALSRGAGDRDSALVVCSSELTSLRRAHSELAAQMQSASDVITSRLPFVDTSEQSLNELNVPGHERKQQLYSLHVIAQAGNHVRDLAAALSDYHTYTEQRVHCLKDTLSPVNAKFSSYLKENARYLRGIEVGYSELLAGLESGDSLLTLQTLPSLQVLSSKLTTYTNYLLKLLPYQQLSFQEEAADSHDGEKMVNANKMVLSSLTCITNHFVKLNSYVKLLSVQSKRSCQHPASSQRRFLLELTDVLKALAEAMKSLSRAHYVKISLQIERPTTERLKTTDECLVKSIETMAAATVKLASMLSESRAELWKSTGWPTVHAPLYGANTHPVVATLKQRASRYLASLDTDQPPSVPYLDALRDKERVAGSVANCKKLELQLVDLKSKAAKLEQDKEHWHLEYQLLQLKHSKRTKELEDRLLALETSLTLSSEDREICQEIPITPTGSTVTNLLGSLEAPLVLTAEMEAREQDVKDYFTGRIDHLVAIKQEEETKATTFKMECAVLEKRLELCTTNKLTLDSRLQEAQDRVGRLQEELHTTTHNYETQLSMMSEHLANMNDKLTVQRDEIDQLKYQLTNKSSRKGKQK